MAGSLKSNSRFQRHRRSGGAAFSDINVTPLVDVMLVLLIVFMVTAPMLTVGVHVDLPKTQAAKLNDQVEPIVISVDAAGKAYLQEMELEGDALIARLKAITDSNPDARIYVRGDKSLAYGRVMEIMGEVAASGFSKVSLIAEMPSGGSQKTAPKALPAPTQKPIAVSKHQKPLATQPKPTPKAIHPKAPAVGGKAAPVKPAAKKGQ
jgi:biopolymer transport protein TolR